MRDKVLRVVLDTNIWIHFLISRKYSTFDKHLKSGQMKLLFSEQLLREFVDVVSRPRFKSLIDADDVSRLLLGLWRYAEFIHTHSKVRVCRDANDDFLLSLCQDGKASHLITGDDDLLSLGLFKQTEIIRLTDFLKQLS